MASRPAVSRYGSGPLLVCHPGGPGLHPSYLEPLTAALPGRTVALLHPRGTGDAPRPAAPDGYALRDYTDDLVTWLEQHADGEPADLLGHSHGGLVALLAAARRPGLVRHLVLLATPAFGGERADRIAAAGHRARSAEGPVAEALALLDRTPAEPEDDAALGRLLARLAPLWLGPLTGRARAWRAGLATRPANADALRHFNTTEFPALDGTVREAVRHLTCPVLALTGELDGLAGPPHLSAWAALLPGSTTVLIPAAGHMCHVDAPHAVASAVTSFLGRTAMD
ncbi:hypothetical protein GCM10010218_37400 [Streptomyces mashuensis]|uniref:AB hydrolase-1 domain-containing protein n=1 Tax=Streptomyces mashuensis TaxID=33904 RepID=A0A919EEB7_9ACTN|nr:alpha/beta hydrolase [Streptomyces mashuensis]GHF52455.1 hypothetical protein GCM10010218_37400 [Streptomyces mashuensis]